MLPEPSPHPEMHDISITVPGIQKLLYNLKEHKAAKPNYISPKILKHLANVIAPILTIIYTKSYKTGEIPSDWRNANVIPAYKKGNKTEASNYRPISLNCIACEFLEHILTGNIMHHANQNSILYKLQHGFMNMLSCETQLMEFIDNFVNNM